MRVNVVIPEYLVKLLDEASERLGITRSALISMYCSDGLINFFQGSYFERVEDLTEKKEP